MGTKRIGVPRKMPHVGHGWFGPDRRGIENYRNMDSYTMTTPLKAPYPWPGGKSDIAPIVWRHFGQVDNYVEAFCGSAAMLLGRPGGAHGTETVNDLDGLLINALRAITLCPDETAAWCDWPVSESDLTSRHLWLKGQRDELTARLFGDPLYCDPQAAGWWLWGIASWIGDGWCVADGPWVSVDGRLTDRRTIGKEDEEGVRRKMPNVSATGYGHDGSSTGVLAYRAAVPKQMPEVGANGNGKPSGVFRRGVNRTDFDTPTALSAYFAALSDRLRRVRFLCGGWERCVRDSITVNHGLTALYLDPPYPSAEHGMGYHGDNDIWHDVARWAVSRGGDKRLRIALSGYYSEAADALFPPTWTRYRWDARGGYSNQSKDGRGRANAKREIVYFSPHCTDPANDYAGTLFEGVD